MALHTGGANQEQKSEMEKAIEALVHVVSKSHQDTATALGSMQHKVEQLTDTMANVSDALERLAVLEDNRQRAETDIAQLYKYHHEQIKDIGELRTEVKVVSARQGGSNTVQAWIVTGVISLVTSSAVAVLAVVLK